MSVDAFDAVEETLATVDKELSDFTANAENVHDLVNEMTPVERAKKNVALAYSLNALLYVHLKTQGVTSKDIRQTHVKQELDRVKTFIQKIKDTERQLEEPKVRVDKEAAARMVKHALSSDQQTIEPSAASSSTSADKATKKRSGSGAKGRKKIKKQKRN